MRNMGESDHLGNDDVPGEADGFRPSAKQIIGAIVAIVLVVFISANNETTEVSLVFMSVDLPLWLVLAVTALLGVGIGMLLGNRRAKAKLRG